MQLHRIEVGSTDHPAALAKGTGPARAGDGAISRRRRWEETAAKSQVLRPHAIGQQAKVPDAHEARGDGVHQETTEELAAIQRQGSGAVAVGVVLVVESDVLVVHTDQPAIGDGDAMGVAGQVFEYLLGPTKWRLGIDDPVVLDGGIEQLIELAVVIRADKQASAACAFESIDELAAEDF